MQDASAHISRMTSIVQNPVRFTEFERPERKTWRPSIDSWRRCFEDHQLDPGATRRATILTSPELRRHKEMMGRELRLAGDELDNLFLAVRGSGYSVSLSDQRGLVVLERSDYRTDAYVPADRPGSIWSEEIGGTNGIGTALIEQRPVAVYHDDHFYPELIHVACVGMPIFDTDEQVLGAINLSIRNPRLLEQTHRLIFDVASASVQRLEERLFYERFTGASIVRLSIGDGAPPLLAVGADQQLLGLNKAARKFLALASGAGAGGSFWAYFERNYKILSLSSEDHIDLALRRPGSGLVIPARATMPSAWSARRPAQTRQTSQLAVSLSKAPRETPTLADCAGGDARMSAQIRLLQRVRAAGLPILLLGETGVGKDTLARAIHDDGDRADKPFVAFNCAAIPESMIDSELFGYGAGAFTGAKKDGATGRVAAADGGTLFLDEIGDMPLALQTRLLRVLESGEVAPLGNGKIQHVDLRVIAATNQEIEKRIAEGAFRQDLYYRLAGLVLTLPPLRERNDLAALAARILEEAASGRRIALSPAAMDRLRRHAWPGNIRELRHVLKRAVTLAEGDTILPDDLLLPPLAAAPAPRARSAADLEPVLGPSGGIIEQAERRAIEATLREMAGNIDLSARKLGISRATLYRKLRAHGIRTGSQ
jgi:transcriptional regulator of acetoin/glycerol metabolism